MNPKLVDRVIVCKQGVQNRDDWKMFMYERQYQYLWVDDVGLAGLSPAFRVLLSKERALRL